MEKKIIEPSPELDQLAHAVIGAAISVHREQGPGYNPEIYEDSLAVELQLLKIPFQRHAITDVFYKGIKVGEVCVHFLVDGKLLVVVKSAEILTPLDTAKVISLLKALNQPLGLLINFNVPILKEGIRRIVLSPKYQTPSS